MRWEMAAVDSHEEDVKKDGLHAVVADVAGEALIGDDA